MSNEDANAYTRSWTSREVSFLTRRGALSRSTLMTICPRRSHPKPEWRRAYDRSDARPGLPRSIHIAHISFLLRHLLDIVGRRGGLQAAMAGDDLAQRPVDILAHMPRIAADIEMRALGKPAP